MRSQPRSLGISQELVRNGESQVLPHPGNLNLLFNKIPGNRMHFNVGEVPACSTMLPTYLVTDAGRLLWTFAVENLGSTCNPGFSNVLSLGSTFAQQLSESYCP